MVHTALKPFPFSRDGITVESAATGETPDLPADLIPGLVAAGYISKDTAGAGAVDIPSEWRDLHHMKLITLAKQIRPDVSSKDDAIAAIEAHLEQADS